MSENVRFRQGWQPFAIIIGIFLLTMSSTLFSNKIERVGIENGIIAQSLHFGESDFWQPTYDVDMQKLEQVTLMPMGYWIQSFFMSLLGDGVMFDKIYSLIFFILSGYLLCACWRLMGNAKKTLWLPLMFAVLSPVIMRSATGNYIEMPLTFFILSSVYWYLHAITHTLHKAKHGAISEMRTAPSTSILPRHYSWSRGIEVALSGICLVMAFFIKGGMGLFPIVMPIILWLLDPNHKGNWRPWADLGIMVVVFVIASLVLGMVDKNFFDGLFTYWYNCIFGFPDYPATVASHLYIFYQLLVQLTLPLIICALVAVALLREHRLMVYVLYWKHRDELSDSDLRNMTLGYSFFICGCLGTLICAFSLHQYDYYTLPVLPFFAIAMACFVENGVTRILPQIGKMGHVIFTALAIGLLVGGVLTSLSAATNMNKSTDVYSELNKMLPCLEEGEVLSVSQGIYSNGTAALYLKRHKEVTLDSEALHKHLLTKYDEINGIAMGYSEIELNTRTYHLYQRNVDRERDEAAARQRRPRKVYATADEAVPAEETEKAGKAVSAAEAEKQQLSDSLNRTLKRLEAAERALQNAHAPHADKTSHGTTTAKPSATSTKPAAKPTVSKKKSYMPTYKNE